VGRLDASSYSSDESGARRGECEFRRRTRPMSFLKIGGALRVWARGESSKRTSEIAARCAMQVHKGSSKTRSRPGGPCSCGPNCGCKYLACVVHHASSFPISSLCFSRPCLDLSLLVHGDVFSRCVFYAFHAVDKRLTLARLQDGDDDAQVAFDADGPRLVRRESSAHASAADRALR
jgi:hypothetical protein